MTDKAASLLEAVSPRARRALSLMLVAIVVIAGISAYYLRPWVALHPRSMAVSVTNSGTQTDEVDRWYQFKSGALGWAVEVVQGSSNDGSYWIFKTVDGARHWQKQLQGQTRSVEATVVSFQFVDAHTGFVAAGNPISLYRTKDGGEHWTRHDLPTQAVASIQFVDGQHGWLEERLFTTHPQFRLYASSDGGNTWLPPMELPEDLNWVPTFRGTHEAWAGAASSRGGVAHVYLSTDGGSVWVRRDLPETFNPPSPAPSETPSDAPPPPEMGYTGVRLLPRAGVFVSGFNHSYTSFDGGISWTGVAIPSAGQDWVWPEFVDDNHWWAVLDGSLYKSSDTGQSWTKAGSELPRNLGLLTILNSKSAWALQYEGRTSKLVFSSDGGVHWIQINSPAAR